MTKQKKSKLDKPNWFDAVNVTFMLALCVTILFPMWDMAIRSFSAPQYSSALGLMLWPKEFSTASYEFILSDSGILNAFFISVARTVIGTVLSVVMTVLMAFPLSKKDLPYRNRITAFFLIPMFFGGGLIPSYLNIRQLGMLDTFWVYVVPGCVSVYNGILMRNYFMSMDGSLEESAFIDGAGYIRILVSVILPLAKPIIATIALWDAVGHWNAWFDCFIYIRSKNLEVVQIILRRMQDLTNTLSEEMQRAADAAGQVQHVTSVSVRMATTIVVMTPILCVYPFVQKYFVKGIMVGSLKG